MTSNNSTPRQTPTTDPPHLGCPQTGGSSDPVGLVTTNTVDGLGRITSVNLSSNASGSLVDYGTTTMTYNGMSEPLVVTAPPITNPITSVTHRKVTTDAYDAAGRKTNEAISDATGGDTTRTTAWGYDPAGRLTTTTNPDSTSTTQTWNTAGDQTSTTLPGGLVANMTYDAAHRRLTMTATGANVDPTNPAATSMLLQSRTYDPAGRITAQSDAMGRVTQTAYYQDGRIHTITAYFAGPPVDTVQTDQRSYDPAGNVTSETTAGGRLTTTTYDPANNIISQAIDPTGLNRVTAYSYNADSSINHATLTGAASPGRTERTDSTYDLAGRTLTSTVTNTAGSPTALTTTLVRDPRGLVTSSTDPSGITTTAAYDLDGNPTATTGAARTTWINGASTAGTTPVTTAGRNTFGDITQQRDPDANTTTVGYDAMSRPSSVTQPGYTPPSGTPITATTTTTYNPLGQALTVTDPAGHVTTNTYDKYGNLLTKTQPDPDGAGPLTSPVTTYTYDRDNEKLSTTDPAGIVTSATYDPRGRQATSTQTEHISGTLVYDTTTLGYDDANNQTSIATPLGHTTTTTFDPAGHPLTVTDPTGRFTRTTYDLAGRTVATVKGQGTSYANPVTTTTYDLAGRAVSTSDCTTTSTGTCATVLRTSTAVFDGAGRPTQTTTGAGRPTYLGYDGAGQLTSVTQRVTPATPATAITVNLGYDPAGNKTRMVDGNGNATTYTYTTWNQPESTIEPSTTTHPNPVDRTFTTTYNNLGLSTNDTLPGGITRIRTYDALNRLTAETGTGATTTARSLGYDPDNRLTTATSPAGNLTFTYTERGQLATAAGYGGTTTYTYDTDKELTNRTDHAGAATFGYDTAARPTTVVDPLTSTTATTSYDLAGRPSSIGYGTGNATRTYTYDTLGRVATDTTTKPGGTTATSITYGYDTDNLLTTKTTTGVGGAGANTYTYDGLSRVTSWLNPGGTTTTYGYDSASNRTTVTTPAGTRTSTYDQRNRIQGTTGASLAADTYTWNARGELTNATKTGQTLTYTYDAFERLTQVTKTAGYTASFTYDSLDRPAQRNTANFGYDDLTNNPTVSPAALGETTLLRNPIGAAIASKTGTTGTILFGDTRHSDIDANLDPTTGNLGPSTDYDPWGNPTATTTQPAPIGFQGGYTDPDTGLVNAHARWYDPTLGTFTSRDTAALPPNPVAQTNRYLYANGSPLNGEDPSGHRMTCDDNGGGGTHSCTNTEMKAFNLKPAEVAAKLGADAEASTERAAAAAAKNQIAANKSLNHDNTLRTDRGPKLILSVVYANGTQEVEYDDGTVLIDGFAIPNARADNENPDQLAARVDYWKAHGQLLSGVDAETQTGHLILVAISLRVGPDDTAEDLPIQVSPEVRGAANYAASESARKNHSSDNPLFGFLAAVAYACAQGCNPGGGGRMTVGTDTAPEGAPKAGFDDNGAKEPTPDDQTGSHGNDDQQDKPENDGSCSFAASTTVLLANDDQKTIAAIVPGDSVVATDPATGHSTVELVAATHSHVDELLTDLTVASPGTSIASTIHTTQNHPFWSDSLQAWTPARDLKPGDALHTTAGGAVIVRAVASFTSTANMYNLTVEDVHTYYVIAGNIPVLVHNDTAPVPPIIQNAINLYNSGQLSQRMTGPAGARVPDVFRGTTGPIGARRFWGGAAIYDVPGGGNDWRLLVKSDGTIGWVGPTGGKEGAGHNYDNISTYTPPTC